ncbi:MAG: type VI secretion system-associated protein TagF [Oceanospirillaceae bacterium]|mgnify:CR=1 FL=1|nr:type VI secretion system-associated protein TagF [Oceanospirillaceae bacterium]MBT13966.1 type VI secretion system-associated protein TagF [Oceanospirillaceae bacterium]
MQQTGLFGKLPAHGDFISRRLPQGFISVWDGWLQCSVAGSQELLPDGWLDYFLTSPIWRFAIRAGAIDDSAWAGVLLPSVDSVGRYFPLTLVRPFPKNQDVLSLVADQMEWYEAMEVVAVAALQEQLDADQVLQRIDEAERVFSSVGTDAKDVARADYLANGSLFLSGNNLASQFMALAKTLTDFDGSMSIWTSAATEVAAGQTLIRKGLPDPREYMGMITGNLV